MAITVLLFGPLAAAVGARSISVEGGTCGEVRAELAKNPALAPALKSARFAVNQAFVADSHPVAAGDEVAVISPVSGGCL